MLNATAIIARWMPYAIKGNQIVGVVYTIKMETPASCTV
jgi:hypothetical protein